MDPSLLIAIAALVFAVASPIVSEWIRGHYRLKEKRLETESAREQRNSDFYYRHRAEVIETFISAAGRAVYFHSIETRADLGAAAGEAYLYIDKSLWHYVDTIQSAIIEKDQSEAERAFSSLCKKLSEEKVRFKYQPDPDQGDKRKPDRVKAKGSESSPDM